MQSPLLHLLMAMASLQHINERLMLGEFTSPRRPIPVPHEATWTDVKWSSEEVWSGLAEGRPRASPVLREIKSPRRTSKCRFLQDFSIWRPGCRPGKEPQSAHTGLLVLRGRSHDQTHSGQRGPNRLGFPAVSAPANPCGDFGFPVCPTALSRGKSMPLRHRRKLQLRFLQDALE